MASALEQQLHFVVFPFMAQGHMTPMIDIARLLAKRGVVITIVTTPRNADRFRVILDRAVESGLSIRLVEFSFPCAEFGLPEGCESFDMLPSFSLALNFFQAANTLEKPVQKLFHELTPPPSCIVSDALFTYTHGLANQFRVPRIVFHGVCCFLLHCLHCLRVSNVLDRVNSETEYFVLPNIPDKVEFTKLQLPQFMYENLKEFSEERKKVDQDAYGVIVNTFEEMEPAYVNEFKKTRGDKVWCIGPVSLCNKDVIDKAHRGNKGSVDEQQRLLRWLDSQETCSVIYACLGSLSNVIPSQSIELGLGLEASNKPFIWVIRGSDASNEVERWISVNGFEERTKGRGLVVRGWAPQVLILSHPAIGGFLTHCGWNSTIEGISAGVPLITWPLFADQFANEKLAVQILGIGVRVGVEEPMRWAEEEKIGVLVKKEDVKEAIEKLMDEDERRKRAKKLGEMAKKAVKIGGSSHLNITRLIQDIRQRVVKQTSTSCSFLLNLILI
ncbi:UDP-glycosyltransferase 73C1 [Hibiscus syriacus]|uniref:Glycosyltransferase n=1 Tax=Hibiscus syriacus TaxID=106335 RepID=A0A6A3AVL9_HIBSY|nr:UDP-glycosyltransferase 73C1-like [Hibiscus syriacus]KAE8707858.1 UDP-glycosyltransferase 73C1 [Hibiscus syriacus]